MPSRMKIDAAAAAFETAKKRSALAAAFETAKKRSALAAAFRRNVWAQALIEYFMIQEEMIWVIAKCLTNG